MIEAAAQGAGAVPGLVLDAMLIRRSGRGLAQVGAAGLAVGDSGHADVHPGETAGVADAGAAVVAQRRGVHGGAAVGAEVRLRAAIAAAATVGAGIAAYLTPASTMRTSSPVCTTGGWEKVQHSKYAELAGVPVALLGLVAYAALLGTTLRHGLAWSFAGVLIALVGVAFSGYLLWAQLGPIGAICQWCLGNDLTIAVVCSLTIVRMLTETETAA